MDILPWGSYLFKYKKETTCPTDLVVSGVAHKSSPLITVAYVGEIANDWNKENSPTCGQAEERGVDGTTDSTSALQYVRCFRIYVMRAVARHVQC